MVVAVQLSGHVMSLQIPDEDTPTITTDTPTQLTLAFVDHGFNGEGVSRLHHSNGLVLCRGCGYQGVWPAVSAQLTGIVGDIGSCVK